ncbi:hypothetical protein [Liquorilactobacillus hordei]|uniref:Uncharacterized protein n=1 Tax=Liquorilactobacillus hordei DSM 19519 TaxID=1423759 RepID=A0A0R1MI21_9LACO|nr:hypothetical protein [Liquorilactobacillus hordei]KRL04914.1 hypothetical protein FC92_GL001746 [Liquorilactobacillus hordei DSM 19519]QYH51640.1 hypothetical protein G6O70_03715 [Liquorilactobacillus hordei DSM 19519]
MKKFEVDSFLEPKLLGDAFLAVQAEEIFDFEDKEKKVGYSFFINIQDPKSEFYYSSFAVKIKTLTPSLKIEELSKGPKPVTFKNFSMGQYKGRLWFSADDIIAK